jgi:hypothetical protein
MNGGVSTGFDDFSEFSFGFNRVRCVLAISFLVQNRCGVKSEICCPVSPHSRFLFICWQTPAQSMGRRVKTLLAALGAFSNRELPELIRKLT